MTTTIADLIREHVLIADVPPAPYLLGVEEAALAITGGAPLFPVTIDLPRVEGQKESPVAFVLALASKPWVLASVASALRKGGRDIPTRMEPEMAASLHYLLLAVLRDPENGVDQALAALREMDEA